MFMIQKTKINLYKGEKPLSENKKPHYTIGQLENFSDERLIDIYRSGSPRAIDVLVKRYKNFVRSRVRTNFFIGADREDLIQEGMIGLFKAISDYDVSRDASFASFASICIKGQISTALKTATRQKHMVLNTSVSLDRPVFDDESEKTTLMDIIRLEPVMGPEELFIRQEKMRLIEKQLDTTLSTLERNVLGLYIQGQSYQEISDILNRPVKSVDNALQRIKRKLEGLYNEDIAN